MNQTNVYVDNYIPKRRGVARVWVIVAFLFGLVLGGYGMHTASLKWFGDSISKSSDTLTEYPTNEPEGGTVKGSQPQKTKEIIRYVPRALTAREWDSIKTAHFSTRTYTQRIEDKNIVGLFSQDVTQNQIVSPGLFKYELKKQSRTQMYAGVRVGATLSPFKFSEIEPYTFITFGKVGAGLSYNIGTNTAAVNAGFRLIGNKKK